MRLLLQAYQVHTTSPSLDPYRSLFTPTPTPPASAQSRRVFMSHVVVPPLPSGRSSSDYQRILEKKLHSRPSFKHHASLGDALQASISHNTKIGVYRTKPSGDSAAQHVLKNPPEYIHISGSGDENCTPSNPRKEATKFHSIRHRVQNTVPEGRNPTQGTSISPKIKSKATRVEIARIPKGDVGLISFHLRFLRQIVDLHQVPEPGWSWVPFLGICEPCEPCWRGWTSPVCQSLSGIPEEMLSLGGCVEFSEEDSELESEVEVMSVQEREMQRQRELLVAMNGMAFSSEVNTQNSKCSPNALTGSIGAVDPLYGQDSSSPSNPGGRRAGVSARAPPNSPPGDGQDDYQRATQKPLIKDNGTHRSSLGHLSPSDGRNDNDRPSAKALGKRRAISPKINGVHAGSLTHSVLSPPPFIQTASTSLATSNNMTRIHTSAEVSFSATTIGPAHSTLNSSFFLAQSVLPRISLIPPPSSDVRPINNSALDVFYGSPWKPDSIAAVEGSSYIDGSSSIQGSASSQLSGYYEPSIFDGGMLDPWMGHPPPLDTAPFGDGTIDPSLISGSGPANDILLDLLPYSSSLSSASPEYSPEPPVPRKSPASRKDAAFPPPRSALSPSSPSDRVRTLRPYLQPARIPNDMVSSADLQLSGSEDEASSDVPLVQKIGKKKKQMPMPTLGQAATKLQGVKPVKSTRGMNWARIPEYDYCHQCRSKSNILKIFCGCNRKFCVRCLSTRYGLSLEVTSFL